MTGASTILGSIT